ncbi:NAD(P)/FAD-dependent oxidoreductase, partial [Mycobacterium sp. ITM-2017-0098]
MEWECVVVGAGAAQHQRRTQPGRARRKTIVIDADDPSNRASGVVGGLLGFDQRRPDDLYAAGR